MGKVELTALAKLIDSEIRRGTTFKGDYRLGWTEALAEIKYQLQKKRLWFKKRGEKRG